MPTAQGRSFGAVPSPSRGSRKSRVKQSQYNDFVRMLEVEGTEVVDLELTEGEEPRAIKMSLHQAAKRVGIEIDVWDLNGHVYFRKGRAPGRKQNRPRSMLDLTRHMGNE